MLFLSASVLDATVTDYTAESFAMHHLIFFFISGSQYPVFHCVNRITHEEVPESYCDSSTKPIPEEEACNLFPCPAL